MGDKIFGCFIVLSVVIALATIPVSMNYESNRDSLIQERGFEAGLSGVPPQACPYSEGWNGNPKGRRVWLEAWAEGFKMRSKR